MRLPPTRPRARDVSRRAFLTGLALGGAGLALAGCRVVEGGAVAADQQGLRLSKAPAPGRERTIEMYNVWGGLAGNAWCALAELYERSQTHTAVKVTYAPPTNGDAQVRLFTAVAGGTPPDVGFVPPEQTAQFAAFDIISPLDGFLERSGLGRSDYVPAVWKQISITGQIYCVPGMVDPNFPLFWNKGLFAEAGLDPETPPVTIDDMERMSDAILKKEGRRVTRIGTVPWDWYGYGNSMYTLGFAFGGSFVDDDNETATPAHPNNVTALQWMVDYAKKIGGAGSVAVTSPAQTLPAIAGGRIGMMPMTTLDSGNVFANAKQIELGAALFPYAEGLGSPGSASWLGGWAVFIPKGSRHPDSAWDFLRFATATDEGTDENYAKQSAVPGLKRSPALDRLADDPRTAIFRDVLFTTKNVRPTIPVSSTYAQLMDIYVGRAVFGELTPKQALSRIGDAVNAEWDRFRKEHP